MALAFFGKGVGAADFFDQVDLRFIQRVGNKASTDPLNLVGTTFAAGDDRGFLRLDRHHFDGGFARLQSLAYAGKRSAGANAGNDDVDFAIRVFPNFLRGCFFMNGGIGRIVELAGDKGMRR